MALRTPDRGASRPRPLPVHAVHVDHGDHLEEGDDEQGDGARVAVQERQPVLAGVQCENEGDEVRAQADEACGSREGLGLSKRRQPPKAGRSFTAISSRSVCF